jgi:hypothetical protein
LGPLTGLQLGAILVFAGVPAYWLANGLRRKEPTMVEEPEGD